MIEVRNLSKQYGSNRGVRDISFSIQAGEIVGLLGPNGAGKSTIMKIITGYILPSGGSVEVDGLNILDQPDEVSKRIGFLPEIPALYTEMKVKSFLRFIAKIKGVPAKERLQHIEDIMAMVHIEDVQNRLIRNLSKGYRQRVGFAQALISAPPILILDEPTVGLDPRQIKEMRQMIKDLSAAHTVIISSHILAEISMICDRVIILNEGRLVAIDATEEVQKNISSCSSFLLKLRGDTGNLVEALSGVEGIDFRELPSVEEERVRNIHTFRIDEDGSSDVRSSLSVDLGEKGIPVIELKPVETSLEEAFLHLTERSGGSKRG